MFAPNTIRAAVRSRLAVVTGLIGLTLAMPATTLAATPDLSSAFAPFGTGFVDLQPDVATFLGPFAALYVSIASLIAVFVVFLFLIKGAQLVFETYKDMQGDNADHQKLTLGLIQTIIIRALMVGFIFILLSKGASILYWAVGAAWGILVPAGGKQWLKILVGPTFYNLASTIANGVAFAVLFFGLLLGVNAAINAFKAHSRHQDWKGGDQAGGSMAAVKASIKSVAWIFIATIIGWLFITRGIDIIVETLSGAGSMVSPSGPATYPGYK